MSDSTSQGTVPALGDGGTTRVPDIAWLDSAKPIDPNTFGWKAANLHACATAIAHTPQGFAVSHALVTRIAGGGATTLDMEILQTAWSRLSGISEGRSVIVRSSSTIERTSGHSFAGLFESVRHVDSLSALTGAIGRCFASARASRAVRYAALLDVPLPATHMAVLVQAQVPVRFSALLQVTDDGYLLEGYLGDLTRRIRGEGLPDHVVRSHDKRTTVLRFSERFPKEFLEQLEAIAVGVRRAIGDDSPQEYHLEVASDAVRAYVLQVNQIAGGDVLSVGNPSLSLELQDTPLATDANALGAKGAAMKYFQTIGLFGVPLWVFPPATPLKDIDAAVDREANGYTVRYSHLGDLGLPRGFAADQGAAVRFIAATRKEPWTTVVHPYIAVAHSFEMLLEPASVLLEHVRGMWESDNKLEPDVVVIEGDRIRAFLSTVSGPAAAASAADTPDGASVTPDRMRKWAERLLGVVDRLRADLRPALPVNVHFVEDADGRWFFLNMRRGFHFEPVVTAPGEPWVVEEVSDIDAWDRCRPLLIRFTSRRGGEKSVVAIAERLLPYRGIPMLIGFGLLSHPAMVLRECGFTLVPAYLAKAEGVEMSSYRSYEWALDRDDDAIVRIRREPTVLLNRWLRVVTDGDPITPGHLLVLSEENVGSFADSAAWESLARLLGRRGATGEQKWILVERGRAKFCTSGITAPHAHGHLFPGNEVRANDLQMLVERVGAVRYESLEAALNAARTEKGEYLLAATSEGPAYLRILPEGEAFEKRLVRKAFSETRQ